MAAEHAALRRVREVRRRTLDEERHRLVDVQRGDVREEVMPEGAARPAVETEDLRTSTDAMTLGGPVNRRDDTRRSMDIGRDDTQWAVKINNKGTITAEVSTIITDFILITHNHNV